MMQACLPLPLKLPLELPREEVEEVEPLLWLELLLLWLGAEVWVVDSEEWVAVDACEEVLAAPPVS